MLSCAKSSYVMVSYEIMTITITIAITIAITITVLHDKEHVMINVCYIQCSDMMMIWYVMWGSEKRLWTVQSYLWEVVLEIALNGSKRFRALYKIK